MRYRRHAVDITIAALLVLQLCQPSMEVRGYAQAPAGSAADAQRIRNNQIEGDLARQAKTLTGSTDPLGTEVGTITKEGLVLVRNTYVEQLTAWRAELLRLRVASQATRQAEFTALAKNAPAALAAYQKLLEASPNLGSPEERIGWKGNYDELLREATRAAAAGDVDSAAALQKRAAESPWGRFLKARSDFYKILDAHPLLGLRGKGWVFDYPYVFALLAKQPPPADLDELLDKALDAGFDDAESELARVKGITGVAGMWEFGGPKYARQMAQFANTGDVRQKLIDALRGVYDAYATAVGPEETAKQLAVDLISTAVLVGAMVFLPVATPLVVGGMMGIQFYRDGEQIYATYVDENQATKTAGVTGYVPVINAQDAALQATNKAFVDVGIIVVGASAGEVVNALRGGKVKFVTKPPAGATAVEVEGAVIVPQEGLGSVTQRAERGAEFAKTLGLPDSEMATVDNLLKKVRTGVVDPKRAGDLFMPSLNKLLTLDDLSTMINEARAAGVPETDIQAMLARAKATNTLSAYTVDLPRDLFVAAANERGITFLVDKSNAEIFGEYLGGGAVRPANVITTDVANLGEVSNNLIALKAGRTVTWTPEQLAALRKVMNKAAGDPTKLYRFWKDEMSFERMFSDEQLETARQFLGSSNFTQIATGNAPLQPPLPTVSHPPTSRNPLTVPPPEGNLPLDIDREFAGRMKALREGNTGGLDMKAVKPESIPMMTDEELLTITPADYESIPDGPVKRALAAEMEKRATRLTDARRVAALVKEVVTGALNPLTGAMDLIVNDVLAKQIAEKSPTASPETPTPTQAGGAKPPAPGTSTGTQTGEAKPPAPGTSTGTETGEAKPPAPSNAVKTERASLNPKIETGKFYTTIEDGQRFYLASNPPNMDPPPLIPPPGFESVPPATPKPRPSGFLTGGAGGGVMSTPGGPGPWDDPPNGPGMSWADKGSFVPNEEPRTAGQEEHLTNAIVGVVMTTDTRGGDLASASVVTNPQQYAGVPGLHVVQATVPLATDAQGTASLSGVVVDTGNNNRQSALSPLLLQVAQNAPQMVLQFLRKGSDQPLAEQTVDIAPSPSTAATPAVPTTGATAVPATGATAVPTTGATAVPATGVTAVPATGATSVPATGVSAVSTTGVSAVSTTGVTAVPATGANAVPATGVSAVSTTGATAMPTTGGTAVPATSATAMPATSATAVPTTGANAVPATGATAVPTAGATTVPATGATAVPTTGATTVPATSATSVPTTGATTVPATGATTVPTTSATAVPSAYNTPPVYSDGGLQVIHGPVSGNSMFTHVLVDDQPGKIVAENPRSVFWKLPPKTAPGPHTVTVKEGERILTSFHVAVISLLLSADQLHLVKGQSTMIHATILGADSIPASAWHAGLEKDLVSTQQLADMIPKSSLTADKPGVIALSVQNKSEGTIVLSDAKGEQLTRLLGQESFRGGPYTFNGKIKSVRGGAFSINVVVTPLLAPIKGEAAAR